MNKPNKIKIVNACSRHVTEGNIYKVKVWKDEVPCIISDAGYSVNLPCSGWVPVWEFSWGEEVLVSDHKDNKDLWRKRIFIGLNPNDPEYKYVTVHPVFSEYRPSIWKYCKKLPTSKDFKDLTLEEIREAYEAGEIKYKPKN